MSDNLTFFYNWKLCNLQVAKYTYKLNRCFGIFSNVNINVCLEIKSSHTFTEMRSYKIRK